MSVLVMFGVGTLIIFGLVVTLFIAALLAGDASGPEDDMPDDSTIDESLHTHGVHFS